MERPNSQAACAGRTPVPFLIGENSKRRKDFFFEKKKQKTFDCFGCGLSGYGER
jgi:hypothetical protein